MPYFFSPRSSNSASTTSPSFGPEGRPAAPPACEPAPGPGGCCPAWACASRYMTSPSLCAAFDSVSCARFMRSRSSVLSASLASASASSIALRSASASLLPCSESVRSVEYTSESVWLRTSISCLCRASSAALASASFTILSISSLLRPDDDVMAMCCCLPVAVSFADTFRMPFASMSKVTSICGTPRGAGGIPSRWKRPSVRLSRAIGRSPWSTCTSTDGLLSAGVLHRLAAGAERALQEVSHERLELGARERQHEVLRPRRVGGDERQVDLRLHRRRQLDLGALRRLLQPLQRHLVLAEVDAVLPLELLRDPVHHALVEIVAAQVRVAVGGLDLEHALADLEHRDVEGAAAQVVDGDRLVLLLVEAVGEGGRRRLVDDAQHLEAGDLAGVLGRLPLGVVEVGGHGDDGLRDLLAQVGLGRLLQLAQDHGGDLGRRGLLAAHLDARVAVGRLHDLVRHELDLLQHLVVAAAHEALDREHGVLGVGDRLSLRHLPHENFAVLRET